MTSAAIRRDVARASVCGECGGLYGPVIIRPGDMVLRRVQRCCRGGRGPQEEWPWYDFNLAAELCHACGAEVVGSGSRWSSFYCGPCKDAVVALNERRRELFLPLGRHSIMNARFVAMERGRRRTVVGGLLESIRAMTKSSESVAVWRRTRVRSILEAIGAADSAPLDEFLAYADAHRTASEAIVGDLERHLLALAVED